jgi:transcriptional regulator with XRE-family HTH domain
VITPAQAKAARKLLRWSKIDIAVRLNVNTRTVAAFERQERLPWDIDIEKLEQIFEAAGVEFADGELKVRLKRGRP